VCVRHPAALGFDGYAPLSTETDIMNQGSPWTIEAVQSLIQLAGEGLPASVISLKLNRSIVDVRGKLQELGIPAPRDD